MAYRRSHDRSAETLTPMASAASEIVKVFSSPTHMETPSAAFHDVSSLLAPNRRSEVLLPGRDPPGWAAISAERALPDWCRRSNGSPRGRWA